MGGRPVTRPVRFRLEWRPAVIQTALHPDRVTVLFDGSCRFCRGQIAALRRLDMGRGLVFRSLHDAEVARDFPEIPHESLLREMYVVDRLGNARGGAAAIRYLSRKLVLLWPLAVLLHIPGTMPIWQRLYAWVARNRFRIAGRCEEGTCHLS